MGFAIVDSNNVYRHAWSRWDNPPRPLLEGESVVEAEWDEESNRPIGVTMPSRLPELQAAKHAELDAAWAAHPGVQVTLADESEFYAPIQREALTLNRLEVLQATLESRNANVFDYSGLPVTIPAAELTAVATAVTVGVQSVLTTYYTVQATIAAATTEEAVEAIEVTL
jgi:hypothetical protein